MDVRADITQVVLARWCRELRVVEIQRTVVGRRKLIVEVIQVVAMFPGSETAGEIGKDVPYSAEKISENPYFVTGRLMNAASTVGVLFRVDRELGLDREA